MSQGFIGTFFVGSQPWTHPLISERSITQRWKERFLHPFVQERKKMAHPSLTKAFIQAAATTTTHCQAEWWTHQPPPISPFRLAQNLSSKRITPTDITCSDDIKRRHRLLKGLIYIQIYLAKISHYTMQAFAASNAYSLVLYFHICMAINCSNGV